MAARAARGQPRGAWRPWQPRLTRARLRRAASPPRTAALQTAARLEWRCAARLRRRCPSRHRYARQTGAAPHRAACRRPHRRRSRRRMGGRSPRDVAGLERKRPYRSWSPTLLKSWRHDGASRRREAADAWNLLITEPRMLRRELIFPRVRRMAGPRVPLGARRAYRAGHPGRVARLVVLQLARCGSRDLVHKYAAGGQVGPGWAVSCATTWPSHGPWPSHRALAKPAARD